MRVKGWAFDPNSPTDAARRSASSSAASSAPPARANTNSGRSPTSPAATSASSTPKRARTTASTPRFATTASGSQPVCVYALDFDPGEDTLLGCKATTIPVAVTLSNLRPTRRGVRVWLDCAWPEGTDCPGWLALRTRFKVAIPRRGKPPRIQIVTRTLGRRAFHLAGGQRPRLRSRR